MKGAHQERSTTNGTTQSGNGQSGRRLGSSALERFASARGHEVGKYWLLKPIS
jgi:hypothetical protein